MTISTDQPIRQSLPSGARLFLVEAAQADAERCKQAAVVLYGQALVIVAELFKQYRGDVETATPEERAAYELACRTAGAAIEIIAEREYRAATEPSQQRLAAALDAAYPSGGVH